jgi:23S rRNA pseudouridine2605 synthase
MLAKPKRTQLNRALSKLGYCSRTLAEEWIREGRIQVNGKKAESGEQWVSLEEDRIEVAGLSAPAVSSARTHTYACLHKPAGYVTTRSDELNRKTIYDLLPPELSGDWIFPVGRLDKDSEGLLLLTDNGEWANRLTDPKFHVDKTYRVKLDSRPTAQELQMFRNGLLIAGRKTLPAHVTWEGGDWVVVTLQEGRNRQIRKMFHALGYKVKRLIRIAIGPLTLGELSEGKVRLLETQEIHALSGT